MPTKPKPTSRTKSGSKNKKSKISSKVVAAIIIGIVVVAGIAIIFRSFAAGPPAYKYSYVNTCEKKNTNVNIATNQIAANTGAGIVTIPVDPKTDCSKYSAEEQAYRLYRATNGKDPDYKAYSELVQKMAGDRIPVPELVPQSFLDQYKSKTDAEFVTKVFQNVLYRTPGDNGASWAADMKKNGWSRKDAVFIISSSPEAQNNNIGKFSEFIKANPTPVVIVPVAQNKQNERLAQAKKKLEEMNILNYAILVNRNKINATDSFSVAKPLQEEVANFMIKEGEIKKQIDELVITSSAVTLNNSDISDSAIKQTQAKSQELINTSWAATLEAGSRTDQLSKPNTQASSANQSQGNNCEANFTKEECNFFAALKQNTGSSSGSTGTNPVAGGSKGGYCGANYTNAECDFFAALANQKNSRRSGALSSAVRNALNRPNLINGLFGGINSAKYGGGTQCREIVTNTKTLYIYPKNPFTGKINFSAYPSARQQITSQRQCRNYNTVNGKFNQYTSGWYNTFAPKVYLR